MKWGQQTLIANMARISPPLLNHYLKGRKNASPMIADRLASLTGTDIRVWLKGGDPAARQKAVQAWRECDLDGRID